MNCPTCSKPSSMVAASDAMVVYPRDSVPDDGHPIIELEVHSHIAKKVNSEFAVLKYACPDGHSFRVKDVSFCASCKKAATV